MEKDNYHNKIISLLAANTCHDLKKEPFNMFQNKINNFVKYLENNNVISTHLKNNVVNNDSNPSRIYGLHKIHKKIPNIFYSHQTNCFLH